MAQIRTLDSVKPYFCTQTISDFRSKNKKLISTDDATVSYQRSAVKRRFVCDSVMQLLGSKVVIVLHHESKTSILN